MKRIDKRRVIASIVIVAVVLQAGFAAVTFFARSDSTQQLDVERGRRDGLAVRIEMAQNTGEVEIVPSTATWKLDESPDVSGTLQIIQRLGDAAGVDLTTLKAAKSKTDGKQTFQITGTAEPTQICAFVAGIERHERLIVVETGLILPATDGTVVFDLGLATYHPTRKGSGQ